VAITYVPDKAPVRQKMLYASTRLTLTRELGEFLFVCQRDSLDTPSPSLFSSSMT